MSEASGRQQPITSSQQPACHLLVEVTSWEGKTGEGETRKRDEASNQEFEGVRRRNLEQETNQGGKTISKDLGEYFISKKNDSRL
jgi:hypothetical protein